MSAQFLVDGTVSHVAPEVVLFDKDGTLIDIHHYWASMIRMRAAFLVQRWFVGYGRMEEIESELIDAMGVDLQSGRMKPEGPVGVKPRPFVVNVAAQKVRDHGCEITDEEMEELFAEVDGTTAEDLLPLLRLLPGVETLLYRLQQCGIASVIVSTDITSRARRAMEALQFEHYFSDIIGADQVDNSKPSADLANLALQRVASVPGSAVVIGDHPVDVKMGSAAGVGLNIAVLTGLSVASAFKNLNCRVVSDLTVIEIR